MAIVPVMAPLRGSDPPVPPEPLPISVLTGFLGSGKTTFLSRALLGSGMADTAVIINEFGEIGLDHLLVEAADKEVVELPNGCLCCAVRQDLAFTLYGLLRRRAQGEISAFSRIALETSGLAEPSPILYTLSADAFLEASLRVDTVVTAVDAIAGLSTLDRFPEATAQVAAADRLVLTKTDLTTPPDALLERLEALNPGARLLTARQTDAAAALFGGGETSITPRRRRFAATSVHAHGIASFVIVLRQKMTRLQFAVALGGLAREHGEDLLRVKGLVAFADREGGPAAVHAVQHTLYPPRWLDAWPDQEQTSRMVFIVRNIPPSVVLAHFAAGDPEINRGEA
jgi:G3E family GTPase